MRKALLVSVLIFLGVTTQAFAATISIPDTNSVEGASLEIPINVDDAKGVAGFQFTINYDASALQATGAVSTDLTSGWMIMPNATGSGQVKVAGLDTSLEGLSNVSGSLVKLQFRVIGKPGKKNGLKFTVCRLSDTSGNKISSTCKEGDIKIKASGKGKQK